MKNNGLSIVIPVYNFTLVDLVTTLVKQASLLQIPYEIRCYDDCSLAIFKEKNSVVGSLEKVVYKELPTNYGRSKIRNLLATEAIYGTLLFLDCDSLITNPNYLHQYLKYIGKNKVVYGGRSYQPTPPTDSNKLLHWKYGSSREAIKANYRSKNPFYCFMSNNFLISKECFLEVKMDEALQGYGYEDTLFGITLKAQRIEITHIDNPLCHIGLEDNSVFLQKTKESIKNLAILTANNPQFNTKLYKYYTFLSKTQLTFLFNFLYTIFKKRTEKNLLSNSPSLFYFDLYKLNLICNEHRNIAHN